MKAKTATQARKLEHIPNVGPATVKDFNLLGIHLPAELVGAHPHALYQKLCELTAQRHDPCMLDVFMAAVDFMQGAPPLPWWHYTAGRKRLHPDL